MKEIKKQKKRQKCRHLKYRIITLPERGLTYKNCKCGHLFDFKGIND